jgi:hypothetical protein
VNTSDILQDIARDIRRGAHEYAAILEPASRTSVRARVLSLLERLQFSSEPVTVGQLRPEDLTRDALLRGAVHLHLDLVFRTSLSAEELLYTAAHGYVLVAYHESLPQFPVGVLLALPVAKMIRRRQELFASEPASGTARAVVIYSLATNPPKLGAGAALIGAMRTTARALAGEPSLVAFSPLTGMRARIIAAVDDAATWTRLAAESEIDTSELRRQLFDLLALANMPDQVDEPAGRWLYAEAQRFAASDAYRAGAFHRSMGAQLVGISECGDPTDGESMWMRAYYEYDQGSSK